MFIYRDNKKKKSINLTIGIATQYTPVKNSLANNVLLLTDLYQHHLLSFCFFIFRFIKKNVIFKWAINHFQLKKSLNPHIHKHTFIPNSIYPTIPRAWYIINNIKVIVSKCNGIDGGIIITTQQYRWCSSNYTAAYG